MNVRALDNAVDDAWATDFLQTHMGGRMQARLGELLDVLAFPGLVAEIDGEPAGLLTYDAKADGCEVVVIASGPRHAGTGTALLDALRAAVSGRIWLVTTNDNIDALRFYQRRGFRLRVLHPDGVARSRALKPQIPEAGQYGIPMRDELELELGC